MFPKVLEVSVWLIDVREFVDIDTDGAKLSDAFVGRFDVPEKF